MRLTICMMLVMARLGSAQGVNAPVAGIVLDDANRLVPVHGVFGNLLRGKPITLPAGSKGALVSASFSDNSGLLKSASAFVITDGSGQEQSSEQATDGGSAMASFASNGSAPELASLYRRLKERRFRRRLPEERWSRSGLPQRRAFRC
jgi:hypothetical protein